MWNFHLNDLSLILWIWNQDFYKIQLQNSGDSGPKIGGDHFFSMFYLPRLLASGWQLGRSVCHTNRNDGTVQSQVNNNNNNNNKSQINYCETNTTVNSDDLWWRDHWPSSEIVSPPSTELLYTTYKTQLSAIDVKRARLCTAAQYIQTCSGAVRLHTIKTDWYRLKTVHLLSNSVNFTFSTDHNYPNRSTSTTYLGGKLDYCGHSGYLHRQPEFEQHWLVRVIRRYFFGVLSNRKV